MLRASSNTLIRLAALVWYTGVVVLIAKSSALFMEAVKSGADEVVTLMAVVCGIVIGKLKARYLFYAIGKKNIDRIKALTEPMLWQFYRKRFFIFLFSMVVLGQCLSSVAHGNKMGLIALAVLELSIAFALFFSRRCFWEQ